MEQPCEQFDRHSTDFSVTQSGNPWAVRLSKSCWPGRVSPSSRGRPRRHFVQTKTSTFFCVTFRVLCVGQAERMTGRHRVQVPVTGSPRPDGYVGWQVSRLAKWVFPCVRPSQSMISGGHALGLRSRGRLRLTQSRLCSRIPFSPVLHNRHQQVLMSHPPLKSQRGKHQICQSHPPAPRNKRAIPKK